MEDSTEPVPDPKEILVEVMASGICGTDLHIAQGEYMGSYPVIPGHEFSGIVQEVGAGVTRFAPGDRVAIEPNLSCGECDYCEQGRINHCRNWEAIGVTRPGGMAELVVVPEAAAFDIGELPFEQAAFMEPLSCILHGFEKLALALDQRVLLMGAGPIGLMFAQVLVDGGVNDLHILERQSARRTRAHEVSTAVIVSDSSKLVPESFGLVIDATGSIALMNQSLDLARKGGSIMLFGVPPMDATLKISAFQLFEKGLSLHSSFTSVRNSTHALQMLAEDRVKVAELISHRLPLTEFEHGIELLGQGAEQVSKVMILPWS